MRSQHAATNSRLLDGKSIFVHVSRLAWSQRLPMTGAPHAGGPRDLEDAGYCKYLHDPAV